MCFAGRELGNGFRVARTQCTRMCKLYQPESLQVRNSPIFARMFSLFRKPERTSFASPGSLTVETALVLPMVLFFLCSFFSLFSMMRIQVRVQEAVEQVLDDVVRQTIYQSDTPLTSEKMNGWLLELQIRQGLEGMAGVNVMSLEGTEVDLETGTAIVKVQYEMEVDSILFPVGNLSFQQSGIRKLWTGVDTSGIGSEKTEWVYVTEYGSVYHSSKDCSYLQLSIRTVSKGEIADLRNDSGGRYQACTQCRPGAAEWVYITRYGDRYHDELSCSGLRRIIRTVALKDVGGLGPCSKCVKEEG